ncbi:hypothetical protein Nepgr_016840 [Nepenthes gracilis]|uniref:Uncharacterized protein n=1 Tax=Nepenthes gracilis TaxID=150966 RepID=A0AAD3XSI4_NEPGR|nr:hypothetical protein Nepgr_016840 [Nepenthes gracilis]
MILDSTSVNWNCKSGFGSSSMASTENFRVDQLKQFLLQLQNAQREHTSNQQQLMVDSLGRMEHKLDTFFTEFKQLLLNKSVSTSTTQPF